MKTFTFLGFLLWMLATSPVARAQVPNTQSGTAQVSLITDKMTIPPARNEVIKVRLENNPVTRQLTVRTDVTGPTRVEINGTDGRPVITRDLISGDAVSLDVSRLPAGSYIVKCTSGERNGMKRVILGQ